MMNAKQLYKLANELNTKGDNQIYDVIDILNQYDSSIDHHDTKVYLNEKVATKRVHYQDLEHGGKYTWELTTLWFENNPVAIIQMAGRYGESHQELFVTNKTLMDNAIDYLRKLIDEEEVETDKFMIDEEVELDKLTNFHNHSLDEFYQENLNPEYKKDDKVIASVVEEKSYGYIFDNTPIINSLVKITNVEETNPSETYRFYEVGRKYDSVWKMGETRNIITNMDTDVEDGYRIFGILNSDLVQVK